MKANELIKFVGLAILLTLCSCEKQVSYENALPKDAALVIEADFASMVSKSGLGRSEGKKALGHLGDLLKSGMEGSDDLIDKIMDNPEESGLDLSSRVYFFAEPQINRIGLVAKVSDKGKVKNLVSELERQSICEQSHKGDGCTWAEMGNVLIAYNGSAFIALADPKGDEARDNLHAAEKLLRQNNGEGFSSTDSYVQMHSQTGDLVSFLSLDILPSSLPSLLSMGVSGEMKLADIRYVSTLDFVEGKAVLDVKSVTTDKVMQSFHENLGKALSAIGGKYLDAFPANTLSWMGCNIDGSALYELFCGNPIIRQQMENPLMPIDIESIFDAIKGDVALAFTDLSGQHFIAYADVTGSSFLQTFEDLKPILAMTGGMMKLINVGDNAYELRMPRKMAGAFANIRFGVSGSHLYVTNDSQLIDARVLGLSLKANPWGKQVAGKNFYFALNANVISETFSETLSNDGVTAQLLSVLAGLDYLTIESPDGVNAKAELALKNKKKNFLQYLWQN